MSRLHRQRLRLRASQREAGIIDGDEDQVDRDAFQAIGTGEALREFAHEEGDEDPDAPARQTRRAKSAQKSTPAKPAAHAHGTPAKGAPGA
jgi:hypothetical protein